MEAIRRVLSIVVLAGGLLPPLASFSFAEEIGEIGLFLATACPSNFVPLNGYTIGPISPAATVPLFNKVCSIIPGQGCSGEIQLPDFRGEFVRGLDSGRGVDSGRVVGSSQSFAMQGHRHALEVTQGYSPYATWPDYGRPGSGNTGGYTHGVIQDGSYGVPLVANETRPRNRSALFCVRYAVSTSTAGGSVINMFPSTFTLVAVSSSVAADLNPGIWGYFTAGDVSFWFGVLVALVVLFGFKAGGMR